MKELQTLETESNDVNEFIGDGKKRMYGRLFFIEKEYNELYEKVEETLTIFSLRMTVLQVDSNKATLKTF